MSTKDTDSAVTDEKVTN